MPEWNLNSEPILVDVDGLLGDYVSPVLEFGNRISGLALEFEDVVQWDVFGLYPELLRPALEAHVSAPGFCTAMEPMPGALDGILRLRSFGRVVAVTASLSWASERAAWLRRVFGFDSTDIVITKSKHLVRGSVLVDDGDHEVEGWCAHNPGRTALLWDAPYNRGSKHSPRVRTWGEVVALTREAVTVHEE